jgi:DNA-binding LacI/PurR family transcriptional regulator
VWQLAEQVAPGAENAAHNEASETIYPPFGEQGYRAALGTWRLPRNEWPDGILVTDDLMMQGALGGMRECGVEVGRDVKVVSHANVGSPTLLGYEKDLTLLEVNPSEIVEVLFSTLDKAMNGGQAPTLIRLQAHFRSPT